MKITHINLAKDFRGGERQMLNLIKALKKNDFEQILVCRTGSQLQHRATESGILTFGVLHPLLGHLRSLSSDLIHVHETHAAYWAAIEHTFRKTDYIITRRISNPVSESALTKGIYRRAANLIGVSQDVSTRLAKQISRPVKTILNPTTDFAPKLELVQKIKRYLGRGPIIGHVGSLNDRHKGQSILIEAFHKLAIQVPDAKLVLIGEGADRAQFISLAKGDRRIMFVGFQEQVGSWIAAMDVFAFPSREEGIGSSVLDAMAFGVLVIASSVGGLPDLLGNNERGLLLRGHDPKEWAHAIISSLTHRDLHRHKVRAAYKFALQHDISRMTERYIRIYEDVKRRKQANDYGISQLSDEDFWAQIDATEVDSSWKAVGTYSVNSHQEKLNGQATLHRSDRR